MKRDFPKIGVLGGGQLGKMLCEASLPWHLSLSILDQSSSFPAGPYTSDFVEGNFKNEEDVLRFGEGKDVITIEIEAVHTGALKKLEAKGVKVYPQPHLIELIQDKGLQKDFYKDHGIATAPYRLFTARELEESKSSLYPPFVQKARTGGYDGRGVQVVKKLGDIMPETDSVIEDLADIEKEISVIVARNANGDIISYDPVEMVFDPVGNLVDYLISPADIPEKVARQADDLARSVIEKMELIGILAVEMFWNKDGSLWVNEVAPRPHNSGHQTIKNCSVSQYEQLLRVLCDLPLVEGRGLMPAMMVNILGATEGTGAPLYSGLDKILSEDGIHLFLYGKKESRPFRKMGHWTITGKDRQDLLRKAALIKDHFKINIQ
jgi:5-(carboxyamino)imidazole ribonucleotide synthase